MATAARVSVPRRPAVRWDRLGRIALLAVLALVVLLYVGPAHSYWQTWRESKAKQAELHRLEAEHERLLARRKALRQPASLMREARRLGMVRAGERAFVVTDLPR
jgi:cell division protein FtsB